jgi:alkylation response protein AidB-like acyl-CoA dehydrogenase
MQIAATSKGGETTVDGKLPWVTNLRQAGFDVAAAIQGEDGAPAFIASLSSDSAGLTRSPDLALMGMRASSTAAIDIADVRIGPDDVIHPDAANWLPKVRPAFLGMQCAMAIGLARRSLSETDVRLKAARGVLTADVDALRDELASCEARLGTGLLDRRFVAAPAALFRLRIRLAEIVAAAIQLELCASGGSAYLSEPGKAFQRRLREAAFIPIITPSLVQLKTALHAHEPHQPVAEPA